MGCSGLAESDVPERVEEIGARAYLGCTGLKRVDITDLAAWCAICFEIEATETEDGYYYAQVDPSKTISGIVISKAVIDGGTFSQTKDLTLPANHVIILFEENILVR